MILYHCTTVDPETVNGTPGLIPGKDSWKDWIDLLGPATPKENAIWLTGAAYFVGTPTRWSYTCVIPSTDRKLVSFKKILRKTGLDLREIFPNEPDRRKAMLSWHLYFGVVFPTEVARVRLHVDFEDSISEQDRQRWLEMYGGGE
jgi:hypothetical protein